MVVWTTIHSQNSENINNKTINIGEFGMPVTSCECNFENLLFNWNKWITNYETAKLLSYEYVEQLQDTARIAYYSKLKYDWSSTILNKGGKSGFKNGVSFKEVYIVPATFADIIENIPTEIAKDSVKMTFGKQEVEQELTIMRQGFEQDVQLGDQVYLLKFQTKAKIYDYYVVCRHTDYRIIPSDFLSRINEQWEDIKKFH